MRIELQPAFVLHSKAYRDTSLIVEFLTPDYGRLAVVAKGVRGRKGKSAKQQLTPFQPLVVSCLGNGELKTLTGAEPAGVPVFLSGKKLYSALYLNELLMRLLMPMDAHPEIHQAYSHALDDLVGRLEENLEPTLRSFEFQLLDALGYAPNFEIDAISGEEIVPESCYCFIPETGFALSPPDTLPQQTIFRGADLLAMACLDFSGLDVRRAAKRFTRQALHPLLGNKPLKSRELFLAPKSDSQT